LEAAAAAAPNDLLARKRLALGRLDAGLFVDAFDDATAILASRSEDPDGLFIQGVVRLSMGQSSEALDLLDRVIVRYPEHLQAMIYRGLALAQSGEMELAISTWEMALEMAGGSHPDLELLLQQAHAQEQQAAAAPAAPAAPPPAQPGPPATSPAPTAPAYRVTVELAPGRRAAPAGVLFVFLRPGETGPPVAVKRIPAPRFPLELTLGADDAMMAGASLPEQGTLVARLSASGSASSRGPDDLEASSPAVLGQPVRLVLGGS
ncbi:MAG: tetratricopeptide repeat protein, partial [Thermoanaerobaculia bacterium]